MNWTEIIVACISAAAIVASAAIGFHVKKSNAKTERVLQQREAERLRSEELRISLLVASAQLSYAIAIAHKRGSTNGEMEEGLHQYEKAMNEFREFEQKQLAKSSLGMQ